MRRRSEGGRSMTRFITLLSASVVIAVMFSAGAAPRADAQDRQPSKIADSVRQVLDKLDTTKRAAADAAGDLSAQSNALVHVDSAGKVELMFHAAGTVTDADVTDLQALGADIVTVLTSPAGVIQ